MNSRQRILGLLAGWLLFVPALAHAVITTTPSSPIDIVLPERGGVTLTGGVETGDNYLGGPAVQAPVWPRGGLCGIEKASRSSSS